jgi:hypothetical protein
MREFLIILTLFCMVAAYLLHFIPGSAGFWGGDYVEELFYGGAVSGAIGILLYRLDPFITAGFVGSVAGWLLIFHYNII